MIAALASTGAMLPTIESAARCPRGTPPQQPPAAREERDLGDGRGRRRAEVAVRRNQDEVEDKVDRKRDERESGEIELTVDRGQRVDEGVVHEEQRDGRGEDAQRRDRLLEAASDVHDGGGRT